MRTEKDNYKGLFESKSNLSDSEENLNKTIDFLKLENAKLGESILKLYSELKKKEDSWITILKIQINKLMTHFSTVFNNIRQHLGDKFKDLDTKINKHLNVNKRKILNIYRLIC